MAMASPVLGYHKVISEHITGNKYSVIYINTKGIPKSKAKKEAIKKAAELTKSNGYRYFIIESGAEIFVGDFEHNSSKTAPSSHYEELAINEGSSRKNVFAGPAGNKKMVSGYKLTIRLFEDKPYRKSRDAYNY